jgi:Oxidoreductase family, NAD-binding Rossmann fold
VGIVGVSPNRGFASIAHIPALKALPDFEISAVCTTRQDSADTAAKHFGVPLAFSDAEKLARHPDVDLVTVSVKVPDHYLPVMAAIEAGKHVYCEWPLGRNTDEAARMLAAAKSKGICHAVGLQGQVSPAINYTKDLIADGYVGRVLSATMVGCAPNWGPTIDRAYQADGANGSVRFVLRGASFGGRPVSRQRRPTDVEHSQHASCYRRCSPMPDYRRPSFVSLSVEPHVLHSQSVVDAVDHRGVALDIGVPAGAGTIVPEDRPGRLFRQLALDPPYQLLALDRVELH